MIQTPFTFNGGFAQFNGRIELDNVLPVNLAFWMNNMLDRTARIFGDDNSSTLGYAAEHYVPPRTFGGEVSYRF